MRRAYTWRTTISVILLLGSLLFLNANFCNSINSGIESKIGWILFGLLLSVLGLHIRNGGWRSGIAIIALYLGVFTINSIGDRLKSSKLRAAQIQINEFQKELHRYRNECGVFPSTVDGLNEIARLTSKRCPTFQPMFKRINSDPWGHPFYYENTGDGFLLVSYGSDGEPGGICTARDIKL